MGDWKSGARTLLVNSELHYSMSHGSLLSQQLEWREDGGEGGGDLSPSPPYQVLYSHGFICISSLSQLPQLLQPLCRSTDRSQRLSALPQHNTLLLFLGVSNLCLNHDKGPQDPGASVSLHAFSVHFYHIQKALPPHSSLMFWRPRHANIKWRLKRHEETGLQPFCMLHWQTVPSVEAGQLQVAWAPEPSKRQWVSLD